MICEHDGHSMTAYYDKSITLLERKKRQWAQERDELENLWAPWENRTSNHWPLSSRSQHTKIASILSQNQNRRESYSTQNPYRKNSLPPLIQSQSLNKDRFEREGETSGYASDNAIQPTYFSRSQSGNHTNPQSGYESSSSKDDRSRWKHKVMSSDWECKDTSRSGDSANEPPNWLKRGLEQDGHIEVTNSSPSESPEQEYIIDNDRPFTGSSSVKSRSYIRGQNIRLDSVELAEREKKREIALQHQQAIRQQLEERERKRSEERRRRIQEEYEEELRIAKEQELERRRLEEEQKLLLEKHEKEEKRKEAMKEAIELAEKEAKLQKMKLKLMKQQKNITSLNNDVQPIEIPTKECRANNERSNDYKKEKSNLTPRNIYTAKNNEDNKENWNKQQPPRTDNRTTEISIKNNLETGNCSKELQNNLNENIKNSTQIQQNQNGEPVTIVIPSNLETIQRFQYAVLMPLPSNSSVPVAIPVAVTTENTQYNTVTTSRTENRILTPTQYRQKNKIMCDSSTQTEDFRNEKIREKHTNIDSVYENRSRKGRISSRNENVSDRPKWGANRPPTRYMKQSEKDLVYQKKKTRQKIEENLYDDKNSSDESQIVTPRYRKRSHLDKRHPRPLWRKHASEDVFRSDVRMYQTEIVQIEADKNNVCFEHRCCCKCRCTGKHPVKSTVDILTVNHNSPRKSQQKNSTIINMDSTIPNKTIDELPLDNENNEMDQWNLRRTPSSLINSNI